MSKSWIKWVLVAFALALGYWTMKQVPFFFRVLEEADVRDQMRTEILKEIRPVALKNCKLERYGPFNDGGYLVCANLLEGARAAYSYGIEGRDEWGCQVSKKFGLVVHQYDCFNLSEPKCPGGEFRFHPECVADKKFEEEGRIFDTVPAQLKKNGDLNKRIVLKMDIEGAEWDTLLNMNDRVLQQIDQLMVEFHGADREKYVKTIQKLKQNFYVANLHFNNTQCNEDGEVLPSEIFEVLFVNKKFDEIDPSRKAAHPHPLDGPNAPELEDCQAQF